MILSLTILATDYDVLHSILKLMPNSLHLSEQCGGYPVESGGRDRILELFLRLHCSDLGHQGQVGFPPSSNLIVAHSSRDILSPPHPPPTTHHHHHRNGPQITWTAHPQDVNVISWNKSVGYLLASGSDDGTFKVGDLHAE